MGMVTQTEVGGTVTPGGPKERWRRWTRSPRFWLVVAVCVVLVGLNLGDLIVPLDRDEGAFLAIAQLVLHGRVPYRDVFDQKAPGIYYLLAGALALTRGAMPMTQLYVARLLVVVANLATALGLVSLGRSWRRPRVGLLAAALWLFVAPLYGGAQLFTEPFAIPFMVWSLAVAARMGGIRRAFSAGLLLALGTLFKQTAILALPGVVVLLYAHHEGGDTSPHATSRPESTIARWGSRMTGGSCSRASVAALVAGLLLPWALVCAAFALTGGLGSLLDQVVVSNLTRYPSDPVGDRFALLLSGFFESPLLWLAALWVVGYVLYRRLIVRRKAASTLGSVGVAVALTGGLSLLPLLAHVYLHYLLPALPFAALLTALACSAALARRRVRRPNDGRRTQPLRRMLSVGVIGVLGAISLAVPLLTAATLPHKQAALMDQLHAEQLIARYTGPQDRLLVLPAQPEYYFLIGRDAVTPYVYLLPVNATSHQLDTLRDQLRAGAFAVVAWQQERDHLDQQPGFPALYATLQAHYHVMAVDPTTHLQIYIRNT